MAASILPADRESILISHLIQISHKHPDLAHRVRTDLDPEELVLASYPIALANKIVPFLEPEDGPKNTRKSRSPPRRQYSQRSKTSTTAPSQTSTAVLRSHHPTLAPTATSPSQPHAKSPIKLLQTAEGHKPFSTPTRQLLPTPSFSLSKANGTTFTSRTITPNGTFFSPLKPHDDTPSRLFFARPQNPQDIPSAFFSPPHPKPLPKALPHTVVRRGPGRKGPPPIVEFDATPRMIERNWPKPTLTLRYNVDTRALRDVFVWAKESAERGTVVRLQEWLVHFRDVTRVREIREVCLTLGLGRFARECERLLGRWENGEWDVFEEVLENEFDVVFRAEE
ncbi:hypothetical protein PMZ80_008850 [Knufia obscura]|nr:hypothetical protein PMZ80_008850 [Knufia obscura]